MNKLKLDEYLEVKRWSIKEFMAESVVIDFRDWTHEELDRLRTIYKLINPNRQEPSYRFGTVYFCKDGQMYEGGTHHMVGKDVCRATDIDV